MHPPPFNLIIDKDMLMQPEDSPFQDYVYQLVGSGRIFFAARNSGLYRSDDSGRNWQMAYQSLDISEPLPTLTVAIPPDFEHDPRLFAGLNGGIFRSLNGGQAESILRPTTGHFGLVITNSSRWNCMRQPPRMVCCSLRIGAATLALVSGLLDLNILSCFAGLRQG
jgi:hypothetical protein